MLSLFAKLCVTEIPWLYPILSEANGIDFQTQGYEDASVDDDSSDNDEHEVDVDSDSSSSDEVINPNDSSDSDQPTTALI